MFADISFTLARHFSVAIATEVMHLPADHKDMHGSEG